MHARNNARHKAGMCAQCTRRVQRHPGFFFCLPCFGKGPLGQLALRAARLHRPYGNAAVGAVLFASLCGFVHRTRNPHNGHNRPCCPPWRALRVFPSSKSASPCCGRLREVRLLQGYFRLLGGLARRVALVRGPPMATGAPAGSTSCGRPLADVSVSSQSSTVGRLWPPVANRCPFADRVRVDRVLRLAIR